MGNIHAESAYSTAWSGDSGSVGICQWLSTRKTNLEAYANSISGSKTDIAVQAAFILEECSSTSTYKDPSAVSCLNHLKNSGTVNSVKAAADYFTALYERPYNKTSWADVVDACNNTSWLTLDRFSQDSNTYNQRYYIDTPKRRGYAQTYYNCLLQM